MDDAQMLCLRHVRLWTTGGYPLWLEVRVPRDRGGTGQVTFTFTTNISTRARFEGCSGVSFAAQQQQVGTRDVEYNQTPMDVEADLGANGRYAQHGVVEDVRVKLAASEFGALLGDDELAGRVCGVPVRFDGEHVQQLRRLLERRPSNTPGGSRSTVTAAAGAGG